MYFSGIVVILFATVNFGSALVQVPIWRCDASIFMPCTMPVMMFMMGPEGQKLPQQDGLNITESQFNSICRVIKPTVDCIKQQLSSCIPASITDVHQAFNGVSQLAGACERPGAYNKFKTLAECGKTINQTASTETALRCLEGPDSFLEFGPASAFNASERERIETTEWTNGNFMKNLCCEIQRQKKCMGTTVADLCKPEAKQLADSLLAEVLQTFACTGAQVENCPTRTMPAGMDRSSFGQSFGQMFAGAGMGFPGGSAPGQEEMG